LLEIAGNELNVRIYKHKSRHLEKAFCKFRNELHPASQVKRGMPAIRHSPQIIHRLIALINLPTVSGINHTDHKPAVVDGI